jgi:predicted amidophosphoribosyltransferase
MALVRCSGCSREVSDKAPVCPHCGAPLTLVPDSVRRTTRAGGKWGGIGFALVAVGIVIGVVSNRALGLIVAVAGVVLFIIGRKK